MAYHSCGTSYSEAPRAPGRIFHPSVAMLDELLQVGDNHTVNILLSLFLEFILKCRLLVCRNMHLLWWEWRMCKEACTHTSDLLDEDQLRLLPETDVDETSMLIF